MRHQIRQSKPIRPLWLSQLKRRKRSQRTKSSRRTSHSLQLPLSQTCRPNQLRQTLQHPHRVSRLLQALHNRPSLWRREAPTTALTSNRNWHRHPTMAPTTKHRMTQQRSLNPPQTCNSKPMTSNKRKWTNLQVLELTKATLTVKRRDKALPWHRQRPMRRLKRPEENSLASSRLSRWTSKPTANSSSRKV